MVSAELLELIRNMRESSRSYDSDGRRNFLAYCLGKMAFPRLIEAGDSIAAIEPAFREAVCIYNWLFDSDGDFFRKRDVR